MKPNILIIGVDPGPTESAYCLVTPTYEVFQAGKIPNAQMVAMLKQPPTELVAVIEGIQSYGMPVGREVFDTCYQVGRLLQVCDDNDIPTHIYNRPEYSRAICGAGKVTDAVLRQALLLRFGADTKGGPLHLLKGNSDKRSAYAIAVYHLDMTRR